jgi:hypothetical protein
VVASGELTEQSYDQDRLCSTRLVAGEGREFGRHHVHRVANATDRRR